MNLIFLKEKCFSTVLWVSMLGIVLLSYQAHAEEDWQRPFVEINAKIDERLTTILCIGKAHATMETYEKAIAAISSGDSIEQGKSITQTFVGFQKLRSEVWKKFDDLLLMETRSEPRNAELYAKDMANLRKGTKEIRAMLEKGASSETELLSRLSTVREQLEGLTILLDLRVKEFGLNDCAVINVGPNILDAKHNVESWIAIIDTMHHHIVKSRNETFSLVETMHIAIEKSFEKKVNERLDGGFAEIWHKARQLSALEMVLDEKLAFEQDLAVNGYDDFLYSRFLQYRASIATMAQKIKRGEAIQADIRRFVSLTDVSRYQNEMVFILSNIKEHMSDLEKTGWQGLLEQQVLLNNKRNEYSHLLSASCVGAVEIHLVAAKSVNSAENFAALEHKYNDVVRECSQ